MEEGLESTRISVVHKHCNHYVKNFAVNT